MRLLHLLLIVAVAISCQKRPKKKKVDLNSVGTTQTTFTPTPTPTPTPNTSGVNTTPGGVKVEGPAIPTATGVDADTLSFPVVIHMGSSGIWNTEEQLKPVVAEVQRILAQAKLEILPTYTTDPAPTMNLDIFLVPSIPGEPNLNAVSYRDDPIEVYVKDVVNLRKVNDNRPAGAPAPRYFKGVKAGDNIPVSEAAAFHARMLAHELAHQLKLKHNASNTGLLAMDTSDWTLTAEEISIARSTAETRWGAKKTPTLP